MTSLEETIVDWHGIELGLLPDRALRVRASGAVLVADLHLGKGASFRRRGVPVPEAVTEGDLRRLERLVAGTGTTRLVVLGDLVHDEQAMKPRTLEQFTRWRADHPGLRVQLVPGNHDRHAGDLKTLGVEVLPPRHRHGGLDLVHAPADDASRPTLGGHVHPCVRLAVPRGGDRLRTPCFWFRGNVGLLPAFGSFTGGKQMPLGHGVRAWAAGREEVVPLHAEPSPAEVDRGSTTLE
ncbi:MAG: ligase-associated DNA damage response endonuclease PdeM [Planctomycetota bacterium]|nr:ligase-associated DNA damage response endonuclease PdeM [Planctomycetota bacterium]